MTLETHKAYIQKNPLFGRKVLRIDSMRPSVWEWDLCDVTIITIDKEPTLVKMRRVASSVYDHQGLEEIPERVFGKIEGMVRLLEATARVLDEQQYVVRRQETLGKIVELLNSQGILSENQYTDSQMQAYAEQYDSYSRQQMALVTDVIDVHK